MMSINAKAGAVGLHVLGKGDSLLAGLVDIQHIAVLREGRAARCDIPARGQGAGGHGLGN